MIRTPNLVASLLLTLAIALMSAGAGSAKPAIENRIKINLPKGTGPFLAVILMHWTRGPGAAERIGASI